MAHVAILVSRSTPPEVFQYHVPYTWKFSLDKNFAKPSYLYIAEIFSGINFCQCGKGRHILYVIINTRQKNLCDKSFANESRWRNWWKFSPGENFRVYGTRESLRMGLHCTIHYTLSTSTASEYEHLRVHCLTIHAMWYHWLVSLVPFILEANESWELAPTS